MTGEAIAATDRTKLSAVVKLLLIPSITADYIHRLINNRTQGRFYAAAGGHVPPDSLVAYHQIRKLADSF